MLKPALLSLAIFTTSLCFSQQTQLSNNQKKRIDKVFSKFNDIDRPGYAIGVFSDKSTLYMKGYGAANLDYDIPITPKSVFNVASVSKQFTAACIALLILDGKLSLEDDAAKYIPELKKYPYRIQIKHLVYMTSGIKEYYRLERPSGLGWSSSEYFTIDTAISVSLNQNELDFKPGTSWAYSNINYMLLTKIVEKVSGQSFADFTQKRIFQPLGMENSHFNVDETQVVKNRVIGYNYRNENRGKAAGFHHHNRNSPHYGGSGLHTTVEDLGKWNINFFTKSKLGGEKFYDLMHQTMKFEHPKNNDAFGLFFGNFNGMTTVEYDGGDLGFSSIGIRFPEKGLTVICLSNMGTGNARSFANQVLDVVLYGE